MSHWNYRIVREEQMLFLTEVYYNDEGKPDGYLPDGATFKCIEEEEGQEGIVKALEMALSDARKHPILDANEVGGGIIPKEE
jgi:hypothetical protein